MKIVIAIDSLKGSLTSMERGRAAEEGIKRVFPERRSRCSLWLTRGRNGRGPCVRHGRQMGKRSGTGSPWKRDHRQIRDPGERKTAVIEMAAAAGLTLLRPEERDPLKASTFGVGQMICDGIKKGCRTFLLGIAGAPPTTGEQVC